MHLVLSTLLCDGYTSRSDGTLDISGGAIHMMDAAPPGVRAVVHALVTIVRDDLEQFELGEAATIDVGIFGPDGEVKAGGRTAVLQAAGGDVFPVAQTVGVRFTASLQEPGRYQVFATASDGEQALQVPLLIVPTTP